MTVSLHEPLLATPEHITVENLAGMLAVRANGVAGPERKGTQHVFQPDAVLGMLDADTVQWEAAPGLVEDVCTTYNKLLDREGVAKSSLTDTAPAELAKKVGRVSRAAEYPTSRQSVAGLKRLIENNDTKTAEYYLSEEFVYELQDLSGASETSSFYNDIGNFFTVKELLRRAANSKNAVADVRESVEKAAVITKDPVSYVERVTGGIADPHFLRYLTPTSVLYITSRFPETTEYAIGQTAKYYEKLAQAYPRVTEADGQAVFNLLLRYGVNDGAFERVEKRIARIDQHLSQAYESGFRDSRTQRAIVRRARGEESRYRRALLDARRTEALANRTSPHNGPLAQRTRAAEAKGVIPWEAYGTLEQDKAYRDLLFDISEAADVKRDREMLQQIFKSVESIRERVNLFSGRLPQNTAENRQYAKAVEAAVQKRVIEIIGLVPGLLAGQTQKAILYYGDRAVKDLEVDTMRDVTDSLHVLDFMFAKLNTDQTSQYSESTIQPREGAGRFVGHGAGTSVVIRPEAKGEGEARVGWTVSMTPQEQLETLGRIISEKPAKLSLRLDLERATGAMSLDIGSLHELHAQQQPLNELLARTVTVGARQIANRLGVAPEKADYHVREVFGPELADPIAFRRFATSLMYQLSLAEPIPKKQRIASRA